MPLPHITREDVDYALSYIDLHGVPPDRKSTKFCLIYEGRHYPPKYVYALAADHRTGKTLHPEEFSGGKQTNIPLARLGFQIQKCHRCHPAISARRKPPAIARLVLDGVLPDQPARATEMLLQAFTHWPDGFTADFLVTPGGFVTHELSSEIPAAKGWNSKEEDFPVLQDQAEKCLREILTPRVLAAAKGRAKYLTIGIDLTTADKTFGAELVAVVDLLSGRILGWTGKSYPTKDQEATLWQVKDVTSHCLEVDGFRVLVLGCHDLNMFSNRAWTNMVQGSLRHKSTAKMRAVARRFHPDVILQHPHDTDTPRIWATAWAGARELFHPIAWASGIYYRGTKDSRDTLESVLRGTRSSDGPFCEIILRPGRSPRVCFEQD
ncbi:MAG: hypothetical protein WHT08_18275 [Bryobacteraceae bacterium]